MDPTKGERVYGGGVVVCDSKGVCASYHGRYAVLEGSIQDDLDNQNKKRTADFRRRPSFG